MRDPGTEEDAPMSPRMRVVAALIVGACIVLALVLVVRLGSPRIAPAQPAPRGHYTARCDLCHTRDAAAPMIEVDR